jgi:hypothetical protein
MLGQKPDRQRSQGGLAMLRRGGALVQAGRKLEPLVYALGGLAAAENLLGDSSRAIDHYLESADLFESSVTASTGTLPRF